MTSKNVKTVEKILMKGNEAIAEAAINARCRFFAGYPITPQNEIPEYLSERMNQVGGVFIQSESEISAINMVFGASAAGVRSMTSSSSPGISLKQEGISFLCGAQLPCVIVNVQRGGPGLGNISGSQADYFQAVKGGGHGDYKLLVYAPYNVQEMWDLTMHAFDTSDKYRNPAMILVDGMLGQMMEPLSPTPYVVKNLPVKTWAITGCKDREPNVIRSTGCKDRKPNVIKSLYMGEGELERQNELLQEKYKKMKEVEVMYEEIDVEDADVIIVAFGFAARVALSAVRGLQRDGYKVGLFRPITLFPFPMRQIHRLAGGKRKFLSIEMNAGQRYSDLHNGIF
ncbi:MAG: 3-methyl-2-oxobutanoate dehydrogenase subunit VorB [Nitrospirae bacterium]|nr:3-methyl-2-oxobutanoate dehydrogenase subunit VorB [Nitrospirota bacterium]